MMRQGPLSTPTAAAGVERRIVLALAAGLLAVLCWLLYRNLGLNPVIFADEWYYSKMARLQPLGEAIVPSYLYLWLFGASSACGAGFLDCVRVGNILLFVAAGPLIYLIGRQVTRPATAAAVTLLCLLAPVNLYTALFMPEASYYFGFILLSWMVLTHTGWGAARLALASGAVLGLMSLVKVHALFLLPALCLYLALASRLAGGGAPWLRGLAAIAVLVPAAALGVKFGLGWLLAGEPALSLFGSFYASAATSGSRSLFNLAGPAFVTGRGHLMVLAVLLPLPMAMLALAAISRAARRQAPDPLKRLMLYSFLMLGSTAGLAVMYTASIAGVGPLEVVRLHLRYYSFVFPLLLLIAAAPLAAATPPRPPRLAWLAAVLVGSAVLASLVLLPRYSPTEIDGPEIAALDLAAWPGPVLAALGLAVLVLWALGRRLASPLFLFVLVPFTLVMGALDNDRYLGQVRSNWPPDSAGKLARDYVPKEEHGRITVAGSAMMDIMRAQFHIDNKDSGMLELPEGAPIESYQLPARHKWLLVIGQHALPEGLETVVRKPEFSLVRLAGDFHAIGSARMSEAYGGMVTGAEGLSQAEAWGRWSDAKQVVLHFAAPLPRQVDVILKAQAYAGNTALPFVMRVGDQQARFRLGGSLQEVRLRFDTDGSQRSLSIDVPQPTAPSSLGQWADDRTLGIGIAEIGIGTSAAPGGSGAGVPTR